MTTYKLSHPDFNGPYVVETGQSERGVRAAISLHVLRTFDRMIRTEEWRVVTECLWCKEAEVECTEDDGICERCVTEANGRGISVSCLAYDIRNEQIDPDIGEPCWPVPGLSEAPDTYHEERNV